MSDSAHSNGCPATGPLLAVRDEALRALDDLLGIDDALPSFEQVVAWRQQYNANLVRAVTAAMAGSTIEAPPVVAPPITDRDVVLRLLSDNTAYGGTELDVAARLVFNTQMASGLRADPQVRSAIDTGLRACAATCPSSERLVQICRQHLSLGTD